MQFSGCLENSHGESSGVQTGSRRWFSGELERDSDPCSRAGFRFSVFGLISDKSWECLQMLLETSSKRQSFFHFAMLLCHFCHAHSKLSMQFLPYILDNKFKWPQPEGQRPCTWPWMLDAALLAAETENTLNNTIPSRKFGFEPLLKGKQSNRICTGLRGK